MLVPILDEGPVVQVKGPDGEVRAYPDTEPGTVGSVRFALDGNPNFRTEDTAPYAVAREIELQVGDFGNFEYLPGISPAQEGAHPCQQLGEGEGFYEIVIGAKLQTLDTVIHLIARRQE